MKKAQRKNVVVEPLAESKPGLCPKCVDRHKAWSVRFCGPQQRAGGCSHGIGERLTEHLIFSCATCGFQIATACADGPSRSATALADGTSYA